MSRLCLHLLSPSRSVFRRPCSHVESAYMQASLENGFEIYFSRRIPVQADAAVEYFSDSDKALYVDDNIVLIRTGVILRVAPGG